jgi:hypothetical protein
MKKSSKIAGVLLLAALAATPWITRARGDDAKDAKIKPYTLKVCVVSGDKLGEMGKPFVITNETREIKFCCKSCVKDFKKDTAMYLKKIDELEAKEKTGKKG